MTIAQGYLDFKFSKELATNCWVGVWLMGRQRSCWCILRFRRVSEQARALLLFPSVARVQLPAHDILGTRPTRHVRAPIPCP